MREVWRQQKHHPHPEVWQWQCHAVGTLLRRPWTEKINQIEQHTEKSWRQVLKRTPEKINKEPKPHGDSFHTSCCREAAEPDLNQIQNLWLDIKHAIHAARQSLSNLAEETGETSSVQTRKLRQTYRHRLESAAARRCLHLPATSSGGVMPSVL